MIIDIITPNKVKISDNFLFPIGILISFSILSWMNVLADFPLGTYF